MISPTRSCFSLIINFRELLFISSISNIKKSSGYTVSWIIQNKYRLAALCYLLLNLFYTSQKDSKTCKIFCFFLESWAYIFIPAQLFFSLNNTKKKLYINVPEMINFNPKISIWRYSIFCSWYNFFTANVSDF